MRGKDFLEALGNIDNEFLEEAMNYKKKKISIKKIVAVAACVALMIGTIPLISHFNTPAGTGTTGGMIQGTTGGETELPTVIKLGESGKFTAHDMGPHAGVSNLSAEHSVEFSVQEMRFFTDSAKIGDKKTIELNGKTWEGVYLHTTDSPYYNDDTDMYVGKENGKVVYAFEINRTTGMITHFSTECDLQNISERKLSQEECYDIAKEYLNSIIDNLDEYELCKTSDIAWRNSYYFTFRKILNGIQTSDRISIGVSKDGEISSHTILSYNSAKNVDASSINMETIDKLIANKVAEIYKKNPSVTYKSEDILLIRLKDGTFYIDCDVKITGKILLMKTFTLNLAILQLQ